MANISNIEKLVSIGVDPNDLNNPSVKRVLGILGYDRRDIFVQKYPIDFARLGQYIQKHSDSIRDRNPRIKTKGHVVASYDDGSSKVKTIALERIERALGEVMKNISVKDASFIAAAATDTQALLKAVSHDVINFPDLSKKEQLQIMAIKAQIKMLEYRGGILRPIEVAKLLDVKRQTVNDKRKRLELLGIKGQSGYKYPVWQFVNGKIINGLKEVLSELSKSNDQWMQLRFFIGNNDYLQSNLPKYPNVIDALKRGYLQEVLKAVSVYFEHGTV